VDFASGAENSRKNRLISLEGYVENGDNLFYISKLNGRVGTGT
jgi:hypothetical protein